MSKFDLFSSLYQRSSPLSVQMILVILIVACILSLVIAVTYYLTGKNHSFNGKFSAQLITLTLIASVIMMLISSNIVISLGMVGALSIIRFRSAMKDSRDTVYIFWAVTAGLAAGCQSFKLATISTLFISIILITLAHIPIFWHKYLLVITGGQDDIDTAALIACLKQQTAWHKMHTATKGDNTQEMIFELTLKNPAEPDLLKHILAVQGVKSANLINQQSETIG